MYCPSCGKEIPDHSAFCLVCGKAIHATTAAPPPPSASSARPIERQEPKKSTFSTFGIILILVLGVVAVILYVNRPDTSASSASDKARISNPLRKPEPVLVPRTEKLLSNQTIVRAGKLFYVRFKVDTSVMQNVRVVGRFNVSGGSGNDIQAVIADEDSFENWKNGHAGRALYSTEKTTVGSIDVPIYASGTYYLGFSNMFSALSNKEVYGNIELRYSVRQ